MPKMKTKKTLTRRIRITKNGKLIRKQTRIGHLKRKWNADKKFRKSKLLDQQNEGHRKVLRKLLGKRGKGVKANA